MTGIDLAVFKGSFTGKIIESKTHKESIKPDEVLSMLACVVRATIRVGTVMNT
jgi:hypothetical protein